MGNKMGSKVTTLALAAAALSGCAANSTSVVTKDAHLSSLFSIGSISVCTDPNGNCGALQVVTLKQPENVVYTTRADVAGTIASSEEAFLQNSPRPPRRDEVTQQDDAERDE